jgi:excisionase family DNA binding protein
MAKVKDIMTLKEVAEYLGVHRSTVYKYAQDGSIPSFKIGADWRFSRKHIDSWIEAKVSKNGKKH